MQRNVKLERRDETLEYRALPIRPASIDDEARSVEAIIASETPIPEFDWDRAEMIPRVLLASGAQFNEQVPLLDSHNRFETKSQLGSIREIKKEDNVVVGRMFFSSVATDEWTKVREGHITDVSAGFRVLDETFVPAGETRNIKGQEFAGPINVATKWRLHEGSITPIGADEVAKMRAISNGEEPNENILEAIRLWQQMTQKSEEEFTMKTELREFLVKSGMDRELSDDDAQRWIIENPSKLTPPQDVSDNGAREQLDKIVKLLTPTPDPLVGVTRSEDGSEDEPLTARGVVAIMKEEREQEKAAKARFCANVDSSLELAFDDDVSPELQRACYALESINEVRVAIKEEKTRRKDEAENPQAARVRMADHQPQEAHRDAVGTALVMRAMREARCSPKTIDRHFPEAERNKDWTDFNGMRLIDFGRECLIIDGFDPRHVRRLSTEKAAKAALGWPEEAGLNMRHSVAAYHVTGTLANITLDAFKKTMLAGYVEANTTWEQVGHQGASTADFKQMNRIRLGALPNIPIWLDDKDPEVASMKDSKVSYAVEARALEVNFSWQLMVNDDMNAISRAPQMLGNAAARTVNAVFWSQITANAAMDEDSVALFSTATGNRKRTNITTGANPPDVAELNTMKKQMRLMRGLNTPEENEADDILNLVGTKLVGPPSVEGDILKLVNSIADPAANLSAGVHNPHRTLTPVIEALLEADSATAYYLFAETSDVDTVEVTFLIGQEQPVVSQFADVRKWSRAYTVVQTFQAKALDHRGMQKHTGAS